MSLSGAWANALPEVGKVTFTKDVAPILYKNCTHCHRSGEIGTMSLMSYEEVRPWAKAILKEVVQEREMPPWHSDDPHGTFSNDRRMTDLEIATIKAWVNQGVKRGSPKDMPDAPTYTEGWQLGEPDAIITLDPVDIQAAGQDHFHNHQFKTDFGEDKWVTAIEIRPSARAQTHHVLLLTMAAMQASQGAQGVQGLFAGWAAGTSPTQFPQGVGRLLKAGEFMVTDMHYHPSGEAATDETQLGFHFAKSGEEIRQITNRWIINTGFNIPAGEKSHEVRAEWTVPEDSLLMTVTPHMHYRGHDMTITATLPDGSSKQLINAPNYDFNWQTIYEVADRKSVV